ncbi:MAG: hypothetical protein D6705_17780 [Deltaproteobacteria bacterium]|nr:MAG: hypothetical protein D6705_17780 [Deltaproteobacteria bacterium]
MQTSILRPPVTKSCRPTRPASRWRSTMKNEVFTSKWNATVVFVTVADDIAGMRSVQTAERLTIPRSRTFTVIEFSTPSKGLASPVFRSNSGFVGGGRMAGGVREFVLPNGPVPESVVIRRVGP